MFSKIQSKFFDSLFEFRHHAYVEMAYYFGMCLLINLTFGIWGSVTVNLEGVDAIPNNELKATCSLFNQFLLVMSLLCFIDAFINLCLAFTLPSIMRGPKWAGVGLGSLGVFALLLLGKVIVLILGAVWILGKDGGNCQLVLKQFYSKSRSYLIATAVVLSLQVTAGTLYLLKCGLQDAVDEGVDQIEQEALMRQAREEHIRQRRE